MRLLALKIGAGRLVKVSAQVELVSLTLRRAENGPAADPRDVARELGRSCGRELHIEDVVAGKLGMHASPAGPLGNDVELAAHIERPRHEQRRNAEPQHDAERKKSQQLDEASLAGTARRWHSWRRRLGVHMTLLICCLATAV